MKLTPSLISFNVTIVVLLITLPLLFTGCWDRREIQFLNVVTGLGFDQIMVGDQPQIRLSMLTQQPAGLEETKGTRGSGGSSGKAGITTAGRLISFEGETHHRCAYAIGAAFLQAAFHEPHSGNHHRRRTS